MLSENYLIQKSIPLLHELRKSKLSLIELKLIEVYLSKINSHDFNSREVTFSKAELDNLLGTTVKAGTLDETLTRLTALSVTDITTDEENENAATKTIINLFEEMSVNFDENGVQQVKLKCSESAMQYFFNIEQLRYLRYKLKNTIHLEKKYSFALFMYLLENKFKSTWRVRYIDLLDILKSPYDDYSSFNRYILKPCCKEINDKTGLKFSCVNVRRGATHDTKEIVFSIESWGELPQIIAEQEALKAMPQEQSEIKMKYSGLLESEVDLLVALIKEKYPFYSDINVEYYLNNMYEKCKPKAQNNLFGYIRKAIETDTASIQKPETITDKDKKSMIFNQFI